MVTKKFEIYTGEWKSLVKIQYFFFIIEKSVSAVEDEKD